MPRYITVNIGCDWPECTTVAEEGDGTVAPKTLSIDQKKPREFLICKTHGDRLDEILLPLMRAGIAVEQATKKSGSSSGRSRTSTGTSTDDGSSDSGAPLVGGGIVCQAANCVRHGRPLANRTGMAQHVIRSHGYENLAAYEAEFGPVEQPSPSPAPASSS